MHRHDWIRSKVNLEDTILEVGCAENPVWKGTPFKVTTLDKSVRPEEQCFPDVVGQAENLPFEDKYFDIVCCDELLEHIPDPQRVLSEAVRVARKKVIVTAPNEFLWPKELKPFWNPGHVRFYKKETFTEELDRLGLLFLVEDIIHGPWAWLGAEVYCDREKAMTADEMVKINLGSFVDVIPSWENIDILPLRQHIPAEIKFRQWDLRQGIPYPDNSVDLVRASHLIEHFTLEEAHNLLKECLPRGQMIVCNSAVKPIEQIKPGDYVLTHMGQFKQVEKVIETDYEGTVLQIQPKHSLPFQVTPDHPILISKRHPSNGKACVPVWLEASQAQKWDYLVLPVIHPRLRNTNQCRKYSPVIDLTECYNGRYFKTIQIRKALKEHPELGNREIAKRVQCSESMVSLVKNGKVKRGDFTYKIKVTRGFCALMGYYTAEGLIAKSGRHSTVTFNFGKTNYGMEFKLAKQTKRLVHSIFGIPEDQIHLRPRNKIYVDVSFSNPIIASFIEQNFGNGARNKKVPNWFFSLNGRQQLSFLRAFWRGDGCDQPKSLSFSSSSLTLIEQLKMLLFRFGIVPTSISKSKGNYQISVSGCDLDKLNQFMLYWRNQKSLRRNKKRSFVVNHNTYRYPLLPPRAYLAIRDIKQLSYRGKVYNLKVADDESFVTVGGTCHNCHRVLKPGGVARISTPDAKIIIRHYQSQDMSFFNQIQPPEYIGAPTAGEKLSRILFSGDYQHKGVYDFYMLKNFLEQAGFRKIQQVSPGFSNSEVIRNETVDQHIEISVTVEATR